MKSEREHAQLRERVQFVRLGDAVVVLVDPQQEVREHRVAFIDDSVPVAAVFRLVELGEGQKPVRVMGLRLPSEVAEEFLAAVDFSVVVAIQRQEGIARDLRCPGDRNGITGSRNVEDNTILSRG